MTYSIVARSIDTGELGVAVQSAVLGVGALSLWAEAGVGAAVTQSLMRASHGPSGLALMRNGHSAPEAVAAVMAADPLNDERQVALIDAQGKVDAFTGRTCVRYAGQHLGTNYAVQANMMAKEGVPDAMATAFEAASGPLVIRLLAALQAAQEAGGDFRGQQSAALKIVKGTLPKNNWDGVLYDLRVDDHNYPLMELHSLVMQYRAAHIVGSAFEFMRQGDFESTMHRYADAEALAPEAYQARFLFAVEVAIGFNRLDLVEGILRAFFQDEKWCEYFRRLAEVRLINDIATRDAVEALMPNRA